MDDLAEARVVEEGPNPWAKNAARAVDAYRQKAGYKTNNFTAISDLLCDLRHLADREGHNWDELLAHGDFHYQAEV